MTLRARAAAWWAALLLGSLVLVGLPGTARAHGALRRSVPASGAHLAVAPRELRLAFNERVELAGAGRHADADGCGTLISMWQHHHTLATRERT